MTDREKYKQAFGVLHASKEIDLEVNMKTIYFKKTAALCLAAVLIIALSVSAFAVGKVIFGWGGNMEIRNDENGSAVYVMTDSLTEPVKIVNGRIIFIVNNENIDISDMVSTATAFRYSYTDDDGLIHEWVVGMNGEEPEHYGYAEYIRDAEGNWLGGYNARTNSNPDGTTDAAWLESARREMNCPW